MAWQLDNRQVFLGWLEREANAELREHVWTWVAHLVDDPTAVETFPIPGQRAPVVAAFVPGTDVVVTFLVAEQYRVIRLQSIGRIIDLAEPPAP